MNTSNEYLIDLAMQDYIAAREELNRPAHDIVTHSVCHLTREAICSFLRVYLESKNIPAFESETLEDLIKSCENCNKKFKKFDFSELSCSYLSHGENNANYCLNQARVKKCFELLESLKNFLLDELKLISN